MCRACLYLGEKKATYRRDGLISWHWKLTCSHHDIAKKIAELALNNNHSIIHSLIRRRGNDCRKMSIQI
jgi:hypothetical protein